MLIGYARVSKTDGSQVLDLQRDALTAAGVQSAHLYSDEASASAMTGRDWRPASRRSGAATCSWSGNWTGSAATSATSLTRRKISPTGGSASRC